jgi:hypothetical protein
MVDRNRFRASHGDDQVKIFRHTRSLQNGKMRQRCVPLFERRKYG